MLFYDWFRYLGLERERDKEIINKDSSKDYKNFIYVTSLIEQARR